MSERKFLEKNETEETEAEVLIDLLVKWIHQPECEHRLDQVLAVLNGGTIFAQSDRNFTGLSDITGTRVASGCVYGKPRLAPLWKDVYQSQLRPSPCLAEKKRKLICFILVYNVLLNAIVALAPLQLPPYVVLEIVDWLPHVSDAPQFHKIRLIESVYASINNLKTKLEISKIKAKKPEYTWWKQYASKYLEWDRVMKSLIVLKGSYDGSVTHMTEEMWKNRPSGGCMPHLCGKTSIGAHHYCDESFEKWLERVDSLPFLELEFDYTVIVGHRLL